MHKYIIGQRVFKPTYVASHAFTPRVIFIIMEFEVVDHVSYEVNKRRPPYLAKLISCKAYNYNTKNFQGFDTRQKGSLDYLRADELEPTFNEAYEKLKKHRLFKIYAMDHRDSYPIH